MCQKEVWSAFREEGWGGSRGCLLGSREVRAARVSGHRVIGRRRGWRGGRDRQGSLPISLKGRLRPREAKWPAQGHTRGT